MPFHKTDLFVGIVIEEMDLERELMADTDTSPWRVTLVVEFDVKGGQ